MLLLSVIMLGVIYWASGTIKSILLGVIMLSVVMLNAIMLTVVAPFMGLNYTE